jgi:hypothetical protein
MRSWPRPPKSVLRFIDEAGVPAKGRALVPGVFSLSEQEGELERFREADDLELARGGQRLRDVAAVEGTAARRGTASYSHG